MKSPKLIKNMRSLSLKMSELDNSNLQIKADSLEIKPWNSSRLTKITASMNKRTGCNIFSLSNRTQNIPVKEPEKYKKMRNFSDQLHTSKPKTAQYLGKAKIRQKGTNFSQQLTKLGAVATEQVLDNYFQENLQSINFYRQFRTSVQQRKNLFLLKPYIKSSHRQNKMSNMGSFQGMDKLKTELYKGINQSQHRYTEAQNAEQSQSIQTKNKNQVIPVSQRSKVIQYMTEYTHQNQPLKLATNQVGGKQRYSSISVLRQKLKNKYKQSKYADKMTRIRIGEGVPITIIK